MTFVENFYGINVQNLEKEINLALRSYAEKGFEFKDLKITYLPDPEKNPHRTYILMTLIMSFKYNNPNGAAFWSEHFDYD